MLVVAAAGLAVIVWPEAAFGFRGGGSGAVAPAVRSYRRGLSLKLTACIGRQSFALGGATDGDTFYEGKLWPSCC